MFLFQQIWYQVLEISNIKIKQNFNNIIRNAVTNAVKDSIKKPSINRTMLILMNRPCSCNNCLSGINHIIINKSCRVILSEEIMRDHITTHTHTHTDTHAGKL